MKQQVILITGASSGIGKDIAKALIQDGHTVYAAARRIAKMQDLEESGATALQMDITSEEDVKHVVSTIIDKEGHIDVLVNNAGYGLYGAVEDTTIEDARHQFDVNIFGLARMTQLVIPHMRQAGVGKIINMSSMGGKIYTPLGAWYHATKHALEGWSDCLRLELSPFGIDVVIIEPGAIHTEFGDVLLDPMVKRSMGGPYEELAQKLAKASNELYRSGKASPPSVITKLVQRAIQASKPKSRYRGGYMSKLGVFAHTYLGDSVWDKLVMSQT